MIFWLLHQSEEPRRRRGSEGNESYLRDCVKRVLQGDPQAFDAIFYLFRDEMYAVAWRLTRNSDDALDVLQEIFLRVYKALPSFRGRSHFSTWLHRVAVATAIDYLRRQRRHYERRVYEQESEDDNEGARPFLEGSVPATQAEDVAKHQIHAAIQKALAELPRRQREVVLLRYFHELSLQEIANVLRCHVGSVKCHLFRAQKRLRILLKDVGTDAS